MQTKSERGAEPQPALERLASLASASLLWLVAFVIFLRHHEYGLWRSDTAVAMGMFFAAGLVPGLLLAFAPRWLRALTFALVAIVFMDLQTDWIREPVAALVAAASFACLGWFAHHMLGRGTAFVSLVMIASTLPIASGGGWIRTDAPDRTPSGEARTRDDLPPILHLVLDEHIASAAIPSEFDPGALLRERIEGEYLARGFRVFPRAFSRHYTTGPSLSHLVNLSAGRDSLAFYDAEAERITRNAWFRMLGTRGYRIRVIQTDYLDFCRGDDTDAVESCTTYALESIKAVEDSGLDRADRTRALLGSFGQLSHWHQRIRKAYQRWARETGRAETAWPLRAGRLSSVSSHQMLPRVEEAFAATRPGEATFAHLLLPHFPYAYDAQCRLRPSPLAWRSYKAEGLRGAHNDATSRAERYRLYLEQLTCTQKQLNEMLERVLAQPAMRDALVIVHGDHGVRLNLRAPVVPNLERLTARDYLDAFGTHFAVRGPGIPSGLDPRPASLDALLRVIALQRMIPEADDWIGSRDVHLVGERRDRSVSREIPWPATAASR
ncbi:MAG: hypothetical protein QF570_04235 [Myxococcota bacterium]|jgi:hypothetical protein|nr:hypothetical protein [Myxococcota bacterium]